ncbi:efflux RND transporter periplasmic adaptor subunit [Roseateles oligotrophus]|uniref:Efflux RND transporter periplasmic adaptor subunit n=1 Tax=Roseateles oligotrophus TaxID=1769250 RepID=A0ABT2YEX5_9BURK|nr:efflux RND transporter periplasmic adaptor subunit [Roseateles oligotrophus]MCV2368601.1 efflux RND transporter periplasmic adaptor subunit [Roseateles oligotrophus]
MQRKSVLALITVAMIATAGAAWWTWKQGQPLGKPGSGPAKAGGPQSVSVFTALLQDVPLMLEASGTVTALKQVELRAQTTNTVKEVLIKDGQTVRKGDLLFRFDERADRANFDKARAQLARDRASLADLQRQHQRAVDLRAQNFVAQSALDTALSNLEAQRALIQADEAALQSAQVALTYNEIHAPMNGRAGTVNVVAGSLVQANSSAPPLVSIAQINPVAVGFVLPETQLAALLQATRGAKPQGLNAEVLLAGERRAKAETKAETKALGRVTFVDNLVDSTTGTIKVRAEFNNEQELLWPGQYVRLRLQLGSLKEAVVIPQAAIIQRGNERSVYVIDAEQLAQPKPVQIRHSFGEMVVVDGINAGAKVVLDGKQNLRPGTPVKAQPAALNPAAPKRPASVASSASSASRVGA